MDRLILTINELQRVSKLYNMTELQLPQIIVVGSQSSGKSSVMERIIGYDILPKAAKLATRCPIIIQLINKQMEDPNALVGVFTDTNTTFHSAVDIQSHLEKRNSDIGTLEVGVTSTPIILQLFSGTLPTLTLIDLPGIIKNDGELPAGSKEKIINLSRIYASQRNSIILAISAANVDLANSDAIAIAKEFDPEGQRTLNVITKIDIMDRGTSVTDFLDSLLLKKSLGTICLVNRNQESVTNKKPIKDTNEEENKFLGTSLKDMSKQHGVEVLKKQLVKRLHNEIAKNIPDIEVVVDNRISALSKEVRSESTANKEELLYKLVKRFISEYKKLVKGKRTTYSNILIGGAKINEAIYIEFEKDIEECKQAERSDEETINLIKNTSGTKKMSLSYEDAFLMIMRNEIDKFLLPSRRCNDKVKGILEEFVTQIIKELDLERFVNLAAKIQDTMWNFIDEKYKFCEESIENIILCEKEDLFSIRPKLADKKWQKKMQEVKNTILERKVEKALAMVSLKVQPEIKFFLAYVVKSNNLEALRAESIVFCQRTSSESIPEDLIDMLKDMDLDNNQQKVILDFIYGEPRLTDTLTCLIDMMKVTSCEEENENDMVLIEELVETHFKLISSNMKCNVSKWIQTIFVKRVITDMDDVIQKVHREDPEVMLSINAEEELNMRKKRRQLEDLRCIFVDLQKLKNPT